MDRMLFGFSFLPKMAAENTNYTVGLQQLPSWSIYALEGGQHFMIYPLTMLALGIVLYYPLLFCFCVLYMGSAYYAICKKLYDLPDDVQSERWTKPRKSITFISGVFGKILHGHEVCGVENLPEGPAILLYYHGALTVDYFLFVSRIYRLTGRFCCSVIDHFLFKMPDEKHMSESLEILCHPSEVILELSHGNWTSFRVGVKYFNTHPSSFFSLRSVEASYHLFSEMYE